jgi:hypothetical protein
MGNSQSGTSSVNEKIQTFKESIEDLPKSKIPISVETVENVITDPDKDLELWKKKTKKPLFCSAFGCTETDLIGVHVIRNGKECIIPLCKKYKTEYGTKFDVKGEVEFFEI